jgi:hypothetical protein
MCRDGGCPAKPLSLPAIFNNVAGGISLKFALRLQVVEDFGAKRLELRRALPREDGVAPRVRAAFEGVEGSHNFLGHDFTPMRTTAAARAIRAASFIVALLTLAAGKSPGPKNTHFIK